MTTPCCASAGTAVCWRPRKFCARICWHTDVFVWKNTVTFLKKERFPSWGSEGPSALAQRYCVAVRRAAAGGHPNSVAGPLLQGIQSSFRGHMARVLVKKQRATVHLESRMHLCLARLLVQRLGRAAALTRQDAAARVPQQWWCVTHPPPVATSAISFCEHATSLEVSKVVRLACPTVPSHRGRDSLAGRGYGVACGGEVWCRREKRGGTTTLSVPCRLHPLRSSSVTGNWRVVRAPYLVQVLRRSTPTGWQECQREKSEASPSSRLWGDVWRQFRPDTAPVLSEQYCRFHIPGTDHGAALEHIRFGAVELIVRKFRPLLVSGKLRAALLRRPSLTEILGVDVLLVANEDIVFDFVAVRLEMPGETPETALLGSNVL